MFQIVCVNRGNYCGQGQAYVEALHRGVAANMPHGFDYQFTCFTDDTTPYAPGIECRTLPPGLKGWFAKLYLFSPGLFPDGTRIFYIDLDTVIATSLAPFLSYDGDFAILRDFWRPAGYGSGIMMWRAGHAVHLWERFEAAGRPDISGGDQVWIEQHLPGADLLQTLFPDRIVSYKAHCREAVPEQAAIICFHGLPRPHMVTQGWVPLLWNPPLTAPPATAAATSEANFWRSRGTSHIVPAVKAANPEGFAPGPYIRSFFSGFSSIIEAGCGIGRLAAAFAPTRYLGLDINPAALEIAKRDRPNHRFRLITEDELYPACEGLFFYTVLLHVNDAALPAMLRNAAGAARRIVIAEIMDRRWRRPGDPPVFNRDSEEYIQLMNRFGFVLSAAERRPYERYNNEKWWAARDTRLTTLAFDRVA